MDIPSLLKSLQAHFGCVASSESDKEENVLVEEEKTSEAVEEAVAEPKEVGNLATAELVFPFLLLLLLVSLKCIYLSVALRPYLTITVKSPYVPLILPKRQLLAIMSIMTI